jgi:hypothetical protein
MAMAPVGHTLRAAGHRFGVRVTETVTGNPDADGVTTALHAAGAAAVGGDYDLAILDHTKLAGRRKLVELWDPLSILRH